VSLKAADFDDGQLSVDSFVRPNRLFTVEQSVVLYTAARIKTAKLQEARAQIRRLFT
jgi:hypothetical protein